HHHPPCKRCLDDAAISEHLIALHLRLSLAPASFRQLDLKRADGVELSQLLIALQLDVRGPGGGLGGVELSLIETAVELDQHIAGARSEEHTSELQSPGNLVC